MRWNGEGLPPVGCDVQFHTASSGWVVGTVVGYYVWDALWPNYCPDCGTAVEKIPTSRRADCANGHDVAGRVKHMKRVFVNLLYKGTAIENARLLTDLKPLEDHQYDKAQAELEARALELYEGPFTYKRGYFWDAKMNMVADLQDEGATPQSEGQLRARGWGRISYLKSPAQLQDKVGELMAVALSHFWKSREKQ